MNQASHRHDETDAASSQSQQPQQEQPQVLVIGAGMSGLACARELKHRGYRILVVEARSTSGGRCRAQAMETTSTCTDSATSTTTMSTTSTPTSTTLVDVGGALIHGITHNPVYQLVAQQMGLPTLKLSSDCLLLDASSAAAAAAAGGSSAITTTTAVDVNDLNDAEMKEHGNNSNTTTTTTIIDGSVDAQVSKFFNQCLQEAFDEIAQQEASAEEASCMSSSFLTKTNNKRRPHHCRRRRGNNDESTCNEQTAAAAGGTCKSTRDNGRCCPAGSDKDDDDDDHNKNGTKHGKDTHDGGGRQEDGPPSSSSSCLSFGALFDRIVRDKRKDANAMATATVANAAVANAGAANTTTTTTTTTTETSSVSNNAAANHVRTTVAACSSTMTTTNTASKEDNNNNNNNNNKTTTSNSSNEQVNDEKLRLRLFQWHKANLELSCGASFDDLGHKWNDDEAYEYTGAHVALPSSWKVVMEELAMAAGSSSNSSSNDNHHKETQQQPLRVLYNAPVTAIRIVTTTATNSSNSTTGTTSSTARTVGRRRLAYQEQGEVQDTASSTTTSRHTNCVASTSAATTKPIMTTPRRTSRRLRGEDANVRRSPRSNKGVLGRQGAQHFNISNASVLSYDNVNVKYPTNHKNNSNRHDRNKNNATNNNKKSSSSPLSNEKVQVTLQNGTVLQADAVVCTLPLGILKIDASSPDHVGGGGVTFDPPLPASKQAAIRQLGCGLLNKCVLSFPHVFWQEDPNFLGIVDDEQPHLILNASVVTGRPILVFMFGGDLARQVESMTDVEVVEMCMKVLHKTCASRSATPTATNTSNASPSNSNNTNAVPEPIDYVVTRWGKDAYARGAFVYIPPGVEGTKQLEAMSEPILGSDGRPLILFAGEHTTPYHPSTIHGAFLSGIREAYRLDLNLFPDWNNRLAFEPDHLYKKTFSVKRKFDSAVDEIDGNGSQSRPPLRRRHHGVMTLRKRPAAPSTYFPMNGKSAAGQRPRPPSVDVKTKRMPPSRCSSRIAGEAATIQSTARLDQRRGQDDRTLVRAYESFRDWQVIDEKVFPVYGGDPNKKNQSLIQLRARYQQLEPTPPPLDPAALARWLAPQQDASNGGTSRRANAKHNQSESRKSRRITG